MAEILLVYHDMAEADDRASARLRARGWRTRAVCPAGGDALPADASEFAATIVYGGRYDVRDADRWPFLKHEMRWIEAALERETPLLGLCLGAQLMAHVLGEPVGPHPEGRAEYGYYRLHASEAGLGLLPPELTVLQSHWHGWFRTPGGAERLAGSEHFPEQAFRYGANAYAFQFHPEATRASLERWIGRRGDRNRMPGAMPPEQQLAGHGRHDAALGRWFEGFLNRWIAPAEAGRAAAE